MGRRDTPQQASTAWGNTPVARPRTARGRELLAIQAEARTRAASRRERVFKHEWAKKRLCEIFGYKNATQWNGYVPPAADPLPATGPQVAKMNTSPHRSRLVQLMRDVDHFDQTGELPDYAKSASTEDDA